MITFDTATSGGNGNSVTSLTWSHTCLGSNRLLVVFYRGGNSEGDKISGATYNGVAMTKFSLTVTSPSGTFQTTGGFYLLNPATGAHNIVVSLSSGYIEAVSASYKGFAQANQPDAIASGVAHATNTLDVGITTVKKNCWVIMGFNGDVDMAPNGSAVERVVNNRIGIYDSNAALAAGSNTIGANSSITDLGALAVSFKPFIGSALAFFI